MTEPNGNTLLYRVGEVERRCDRLSDRLHLTDQLAGDHEEQINGKRGLHAAVDDLTLEVKALRQMITTEVKALRQVILTVGGGIVVAAVTFALSMLGQ